MKKIKSLNELTFKSVHDGSQYLGFFDNGYGVSVVSHSFSYGGTRGLYEVAVITGSPEKWELCYTTEITSDVLGYLTLEEAIEVVNRVIELQPAPIPTPKVVIPVAYIWGNDVWIKIGEYDNSNGLSPKYVHADIVLGICSYTREEIMAYTKDKALACEGLLDLYEVRRTGRGTVHEE